MDFFGQQEQARRRTAMLVLLFSAAVVVIVLAVYGAVAIGLYLGQFFQGRSPLFTLHSLWDPDLFAWTTGLTALIIAGGSLYRSWQLRQGGGAAVAEMLGGERVPPNTDDPLLRRLLNVSEEMAIASGLPAPPVYLLQQSGINAFAAGFSPRDAVIAVTRGAVELLNRDELQGVIAHEFSHILNGDTRLKMRLMGLLFGITLISDAGILMMTSRRSTAYASSGRERGVHPALLVLGFLVFLVGTLGAVFADLIKRAVSRQREFLADAAAVQFTRNPSGIANALKVIGGYREGSRIRHAAADQASHFFFGNALKSWRRIDWWATHPPLEERIRRLDPSFRGSMPSISPAARSAQNYAEAASAMAAAQAIPAEHATSRPQVSLERLMQDIGQPGPEHLHQARRLLRRIPDSLKALAHDPYAARAMVYAMLLHREAAIRSAQMQALEKVAEANVLAEMLHLQGEIRALDAELRLPLLELLLPALKSLSKPQYVRFRRAVNAVIRADGRVSVFEYMLHRMLLRHLKPAFAKPSSPTIRYRSLPALKQECETVLCCLLAYGAHREPARVFERACAMLELEADVPASFECRLGRLDAALRKLEQASEDIRRRLLKAAVYCVLADGRLAIEELELVRAIADALDAPMPPLSAESYAGAAIAAAPQQET